MVSFRRDSNAIRLVSAFIVVCLFCSMAIVVVFIPEANGTFIEKHVDGIGLDTPQTSTSTDRILYWTQITPVNQESAIDAGIVDGGICWEPYWSEQLVDGTAKVLVQSSAIMPGYPSEVIAANYNSATFPDNATNHQLVARVLRANSDATDWIERTIHEGMGANYTSLLNMGAQFVFGDTSSRSINIIQSALAHIDYGYELTPAIREGLVNFTSAFDDLGLLSSFGGYSNATDFVNGIVNSSDQAVSASLSPSSTILGTIRLGYLNGDLQQFARMVAMNTSLWGGKNLFQVWGVDVTSPAPFANGGALMNGFAVNLIDMGYLGCAPAIIKRINSNIPIEIVSLVDADGSAILVKPSVTSLDDLNLKTVASPGPASLEHLLLLQWASMNGFAVGLVGTDTVSTSPRDLNVTAGIGHIDLQWAEPYYFGGTVTNYTIYRGTTSGGESKLTTIGTALSYNDTSVTPGQTYYYEVSATNSIGESARSNETSARVPTVPSAPLNLHAVAGDGFCALSWAPPSDPGVGGLTYHLFRDSQPIWNGSAISHNDTGVINGITYNYTVAANNSIGWGLNSTSIAATPFLPEPPGIPTGLHLVASSGQVSINWTVPSISGDSPITGYKLYRGNSSDSLIYLVSVIGTNYTDTGLTNGQTYWYEVSAVNAVGEGVKAASVSSTPFTVPDAPTGLTAIAGNLQLSLNWTVPVSNGGREIDYYVVYQDGVALPNNVPGLNTTITGLTNGQNYSFSVAAHNDAGNGTRSNAMAITPATAPGAPTGVTSTPGIGKVTITWQAPSSTGGSPIIGYVLYRDSNPLVIVNASILSYLDTSCKVGTTYYYYVTAYNAVNTGPVSAFVSVTLQPDNTTLYAGIGIIAIALAVVLVGAFFVIRKRRGKN